jgi:hypothetical protein
MEKTRGFGIGRRRCTFYEMQIAAGLTPSEFLGDSIASIVAVQPRIGT